MTATGTSSLHRYFLVFIVFVAITILYYEFTNRLLLLNILTAVNPKQYSISAVSNRNSELKIKEEEEDEERDKKDQRAQIEEYFLPQIENLKAQLRKNLAPRLQSYPEYCKESELWGHEHHGGWYICKDFLPKSDKCLIYSFGLGADWSFDTRAEELGCEVHGFDPSNQNWKEGMHGKAYSGFDYANQYPSKLKFFHNWGLGAADRAVYPPGTIPQEWPGLGDPAFSQSNSESWETKSLERTILDLGHLQNKLSIIKIDVEGSEWDAIQAFISSKETKEKLQHGFVSQLLFEFHWDPDSPAKNKRHEEILNRIVDLGFIPWKIETHQGSECCLDISYVWVGKKINSNSGGSSNSGSNINNLRKNLRWI